MYIVFDEPKSSVTMMPIDRLVKRYRCVYKTVC